MGSMLLKWVRKMVAVEVVAAARSVELSMGVDLNVVVFAVAIAIVAERVEQSS